MTTRSNTQGDPESTGVHTSIPGRIAFLLSILGVLVSAYLTYEHYTDSATLACSDNGAVNCLKVTTSPWSEILGVPVAVTGLAYFLVMAVLCAPLPFTRHLEALRLVGVAAGTLMVLWLIYVELFKVDAICLWCTAIHLITLLLLGAVLWSRQTDLTDQ